MVIERCVRGLASHGARLPRGGRDDWRRPRDGVASASNVAMVEAAMLAAGTGWLVRAFLYWRESKVR